MAVGTLNLVEMQSAAAAAHSKTWRMFVPP